MGVGVGVGGGVGDATGAGDGDGCGDGDAVGCGVGLGWGVGLGLTWGDGLELGDEPELAWELGEGDAPDVWLGAGDCWAGGWLALGFGFTECGTGEAVLQAVPTLELATPDLPADVCGAGINARLPTKAMTRSSAVPAAMITKRFMTSNSSCDVSSCRQPPATEPNGSSGLYLHRPGRRVDRWLRASRAGPARARGPDPPGGGGAAAVAGMATSGRPRAAPRSA